MMSLACRCSLVYAFLFMSTASSIARGSVEEAQRHLAAAWTLHGGHIVLADTWPNTSISSAAEVGHRSGEVQEQTRSQFWCFDGFYDRELEWQNVLIDHTSKLNALNLAQFNIHISATPRVAVPGDEEFTALHFSDKPDSASNIGFSMFGNAHSLRISMSDGSHHDEQLFSGWTVPIAHEVMYQVGCWMAEDYSYRWCKAIVNGVFYGSKQFIVPGNIYKLDGGQFGQGKFYGKLHSIQVCDGTNGTLENTRLTTTTLSVTSGVSEGVHRRRRGTATCDAMPCTDWHMRHVPLAEIVKCESTRCTDVDVKTCCREIPWPRAPDFSGIPGLDIPQGVDKFTMWHLTLLILALICMCCVSAGSVTAYMKYKELQLAKSIFDLESLNAYDYLEVPEKITEDMGKDITRIARSLLEIEANCDKTASDFWPKVFICCPVVQRPGDADRCGPGMYYAIAVSILLFQAGIKCFCNLMVPGSDGEQLSLLHEKLRSERSKCKVLVVVQFPGLYQSLQGLLEINAARDLRIESIIPLAFERPIPPAEEQWPLHEEEADLSEIRQEVALLMLTSIPLPPDSMVATPSLLPGVVAEIKRALGMDSDMHSI